TFFKQPVMQRAHHGMLMGYSVRQQGLRYRLDDITIEAIPHVWVVHDILFFHHFLELIGLFVLYGQSCPALFELLLVLYAEPTWHDTDLGKRWLLCRFFAIIGVYPEDHDSFAP